MAEEDNVGENLNCDDLMNISLCADVNNNKEKTMKIEKELKFHEAWLETPCLYEINTKFASINVEDNFAEVHMRDTRNSERKHSPIKLVIILRRARIRIQAF